MLWSHNRGATSSPRILFSWGFDLSVVVNPMFLFHLVLGRSRAEDDDEATGRKLKIASYVVSAVGAVLGVVIIIALCVTLTESTAHIVNSVNPSSYTTCKYSGDCTYGRYYSSSYGCYQCCSYSYTCTNSYFYTYYGVNPSGSCCSTY